MQRSEEAWDFFEKYEDYVLGVISDIDFERNGQPDIPGQVLNLPKTSKLARQISRYCFNQILPNLKHRRECWASFLLKDSPTLLHELRQFMIQSFSGISYSGLRKASKSAGKTS